MNGAKQCSLDKRGCGGALAVIGRVLDLVPGMCALLVPLPDHWSMLIRAIYI